MYQYILHAMHATLRSYRHTLISTPKHREMQNSSLQLTKVYVILCVCFSLDFFWVNHLHIVHRNLKTHYYRQPQGITNTNLNLVSFFCRCAAFMRTSFSCYLTEHIIKRISQKSMIDTTVREER